MNKICIIGLGYVGLPLLTAFSKKYDSIGYDINQQRIRDLQNNIDVTNEVSNKELEKSSALYTNDIQECAKSNIFIVTVPTPINENKEPDLEPLIKASEKLSKILKINDIVIYESTVYPGVTEDVCVPVLEKSGLIFNKDFYVGYSPERINPGDRMNKLESIKKVVSGSNKSTLKKVSDLYSKIILAGVHEAPSIKVAEASKVVENIQRDVNIALINELAKIFDGIDINTSDVIEAADTKWNFVKYNPGLVGGHCISVDPYYLVRKASSIGRPSRLISEAREINESMIYFVREKLVKLLISKKIHTKDAQILILGYTFKADCPDTRNTKIYPLMNVLKELGMNVTICDPYSELINKKHVKKNIPDIKYDALIMAVPHQEFLKFYDGEKIQKNMKKNSIIFDITNTLSDEIVDGRM